MLHKRMFRRLENGFHPEKFMLGKNFLIDQLFDASMLRQEFFHLALSNTRKLPLFERLGIKDPHPEFHFKLCFFELHLLAFETHFAPAFPREDLSALEKRLLDTGIEKGHGFPVARRNRLKNLAPEFREKFGNTSLVKRLFLFHPRKSPLYLRLVCEGPRYRFVQAEKRTELLLGKALRHFSMKGVRANCRKHHRQNETSRKLHPSFFENTMIISGH